jgi:hypothetical protein
MGLEGERPGLCSGAVRDYGYGKCNMANRGCFAFIGMSMTGKGITVNQSLDLKNYTWLKRTRWRPEG